MVNSGKIGLHDVRQLGHGETIWDGEVPGFGARRQTGDAVSYIVFYRTREGRQRFQTIGRHGEPAAPDEKTGQAETWTPTTARKAARRILSQVVGGADPMGSKKETRNAATVAELCDLYIADAEAGRLILRKRSPKKASTIATDKSRIEAHIKPLLGGHRVNAVIRYSLTVAFDVWADEGVLIRYR